MRRQPVLACPRLHIRTVDEFPGLVAVGAFRYQRAVPQPPQITSQTDATSSTMPNQGENGREPLPSHRAGSVACVAVAGFSCDMSRCGACNAVDVDAAERA